MVRVRYGTNEALVDSILTMTSLYESRLRSPDEPGMAGLDRVLAVPRLLHQFAVGDSLTQIRSALERGRADGTVRADIGSGAQSREILGSVIGYSYFWTVDPDNFDVDPCGVRARSGPGR